MRAALAEQAASAASVRWCDKNNDDKGGGNDDNNDGGAQDDNSCNYGAHNEDEDEGVTADGVVPERLQKFPLKDKEV